MPLNSVNLPTKLRRGRLLPVSLNSFKTEALVISGKILKWSLPKPFQIRGSLALGS